MWAPPPNMHGERMPLPNKLIAVSIDKDRGSQIALKWTVDHLLARGQSVLLIHVKLKQSANSSGQSPQTNDGGSGNTQLDPQTKELFLPFRVFCTRKDIQCYDVVLDDTDVAKAVVEYVNRTGVEVLIVGASARGGLLRFKAKDIPGGMLKGAPDFCTVHVISKSGKISSTRAASRSAPFVHPLRHQLMQPASTKFAPFDTSTPSSTNSRSSFPGGPKPVCDPPPSTLQSDTMSIKSPFTHRKGPNGKPYEISLPDLSLEADRTSFSQGPGDDLEAEMRRLKQELKQTMEMYSTACKEALTAKQKAMELQRLAELEAQKRISAEMKALKEAEEKNKILNKLSNSDVRYRKYTIEEIESATDYFAQTRKIGEGGYVIIN